MGVINMRKAAVSFLTVFVCIFMFAGCYTGKNLEERINMNERQRWIDEVSKDTLVQSETSKVTMDVKENNLIFKVYLKVSYSHLQTIQLQSLLKNHDESKRINQLKDSVKKRYGIRPVEVTMSFYGADGKLVGTIKG